MSIDLGPKVGPLPVGVWGAAVVGGIGIGLYRRRNAKPAPVPVPIDQSTTLGLPGGMQPGPGGTLALPDNSAYRQTGPITAAILTNAQWQTTATTALVAAGYQPTVVANALSRYTIGQTLSTQEQAVVDIAISKVGPAPQPPRPTTLPPSTVVAAPSAALPPGVPAADQAGNAYGSANYAGPRIGFVYGNRGTYTTKAGDTPTSVSTHVYGTSTDWGRILAANPTQPGLTATDVPPGLTLWLPW